MTINETNLLMKPQDLYFTALRPTAKIPSKRLEDVGYDVYADFEEDYLVIPPHTVAKVPTGIASAFHHSKGIILKERGSTGTLNLTQKAGVIDSGYRAEWFVPIANDNEYPIIITKLSPEETIKAQSTLSQSQNSTLYSKVKFYPYDKAIAQAVVFDVPVMNVQAIAHETLLSFHSERGVGAIGSSGK